MVVNRLGARLGLRRDFSAPAVSCDLVALPIRRLLDRMQMDAHEPFALESFAGPVRDWLAKEQTQAEVRRRFVSDSASVCGSWCSLWSPRCCFRRARVLRRTSCLQRDFLVSYTTGTGHNVHERVIDDMCAASGVSLVISYLHLAHHSPILAVWLADLPAPMLALFNQVGVSHHDDSNNRQHAELVALLPLLHLHFPVRRHHRRSRVPSSWSAIPPTGASAATTSSSASRTSPCWMPSATCARPISIASSRSRALSQGGARCVRGRHGAASACSTLVRSCEHLPLHRCLFRRAAGVSPVETRQLPL